MAKLSSRPYKEQIEKAINFLREGKPIIFYDLETTGLKPLTSKILS